MKKSLVLVILVLLLAASALAVTGPKTFNGKSYYVVTSTDQTEDSGNEVCTKMGMKCVGYTEPTTAVCKLFHPGAADTSSMSGDLSGVYCNGAPQSGVCAAETDTCHACPACTNTVSCSTAIGGLYMEMYVECASGSCKINIVSQNTQDFFKEIPSLNAQLQGCPVALPKGTGLVLANGITQVNVAMNTGAIQGFYLTVSNGLITGIAAGTSSCKQRLAMMESDLDTILLSSNQLGTVSSMIASKKIGISGCKLLTKIKLAIIKPVINYIAKKQAPPTPPPPKPPPNCGQIGEQCNNRACWSGMCGAPKEFVNGQWRYVNYRCITQAEYTANCIGQGNTPPAWSCLVGPCQ